MANYQEVGVKLTNKELKKLKSAAKNKTGTILRLNKKNFEDEELPHELFLTTRQATKIRNAFANNMSTDIKLPHELFLTTRQTTKIRNAFAINMSTNIKLSQAQTSEIIQSRGSFRSWLGNLEKKALTYNAIPLARDNLL